MVKAIQKELALRQDYLEGQPIETIYFGGGTPSLLSYSEITGLLNIIQEKFNVSQAAEITLEANPDDLSEKKLKELQDSGVNRLSIGIQSFDNKVLRRLNRAHSSAEAIQCLKTAQEIGISNISIDLIYGIPGRSHTQWNKDLEQATYHRPTHISAYSLTIEPYTVFGNRVKNDKMLPPDDEKAASQFEFMTDYLREEGFEHYEISNFSLPGFYSRHNTSYWQQKHYLGVGPSAHSYNGNSRQHNIEKNALYIKEINANTPLYTIEKLTLQDKVNEYLLTTLRTQWGADLIFLKDTYNVDVAYQNSNYLNQLKVLGHIQMINNRIILTDSGKLLADKICADLFV